MAPTASRMSAYAVTSSTGSTACCWRARRRVSKPEMPGMRTSEIIMLKSSPRRTSSARSPEATGTVSKPWLFRNESSRLRCPASSSTIRTRGDFGVLLPASGGMDGAFRGQTQVGKAEQGAFWLVGQAFDLPAVRQDDLLHHRQTEAGPFLVRREIGFEDLGAVFRRDARAVIANFKERLLVVPFAGDDPDFTARFDGLDGIVQEIEQRLAEQLFIRLNHQLFVHDLQSNVFLLDIVIQRPHDFADDRPQRQRGTADFARSGIVDEFVELGGNPVGLLEDFP